jgi:hypothetical protein
MLVRLRVRALVQSRTDIALGTANAGSTTKHR